jgi:alanyl-tRNA synthetase
MFGMLTNLSGKVYGTDEALDKSFRIIADHVRAATFIIGDARGVAPSNVGQGYIVRRLIRRAIREGRRLGITEPFSHFVAEVVVGEFGSHYTELAQNFERIVAEFKKEEEKFGKTLEKGMRELEKMASKGDVTGEQAFVLFSTYGFPWELTEEMLRERGMNVDRHAFEAEFKKHQELSRTASAGVFKGGLADNSVETTRLHTATHLLHQALRTVLGDHVGQKGSNITAERLRFDFSHPDKMTPDQLKQVEEIVNDVIRRDLPVHFEELTTEEARAMGAIGFFEDKYAQLGGKIKVYVVGSDEKGYFSKEICGGPHVTHTGELGSFKIQKEEAVSAGVRRIKATIGG